MWTVKIMEKLYWEKVWKVTFFHGRKFMTMSKFNKPKIDV
jgi:hypothetical protein